MTIDEAKRIIKIVLVIAEDFEITVQGEEFTKEKCKEAVEIVTKALEQEPCDDCIRREDALMALTGEYTDSLSEILPKAIKRINALPPVNPAEKQEPCTDAISREAVLEILNNAYFLKLDDGAALQESVNQLPPVKPQYTDAEIQKMQDLEFAEIQKAYEIGKEEGSSEKPNKWIPITKRPMTEDEKPWHESCYDEAEILDCPLPEDGEDVLITVNGITWIDTFIRDETDGCYFESYDIDEVKAWQRLPEPYKASQTGVEGSDKE